MASSRLQIPGSPRMMSVFLTDSASVFKGSGPFAGPGPGLGPGPGPGSEPDPWSWSFSGPFVKSAAMRAVVAFELYGFVSCSGSIGPSANIKVEDKVKSELQAMIRWWNNQNSQKLLIKKVNKMYNIYTEIWTETREVRHFWKKSFCQEVKVRAYKVHPSN